METDRIKIAEKKIKSLIKKTNQVSLYTILSGRIYTPGKGWGTFKKSGELMLTVAELVADAVGGSGRTKEMIKENIIYYPSSLIKRNSWMSERIMFTINTHDKSIRCSYYAGQDYEAEIKSVRKHLKS